MKTFLSKYYSFLKNDNTFLPILAFLTFIGGFLIYWGPYQRDWYEAIIYSIFLFTLDIKMPNDFGILNPAIEWKFIYIFGFTAMISTFSAVILTFMDRLVLKLNLENIIKKNNFIIVCGLGTNCRAFIDNLLRNNVTHDIIVIEKNKNNEYIEYYQQKGIGIIISDATDKEIYSKLNLNEDKKILVSVGNDMTNLEIVSQITKTYKSKLYVHIDNKRLRHFHKEGKIFLDSNIKMFSYYEDIARDIFEEHDIDGNDNEIILSNENYSIAIIGNTNLACEIVSQACLLGQLPNENQLTIYCIDKDTEEFKQNIDLNHTQINNVPNVVIKYINLDVKQKAFYTNDIWYEKNLTNIILCFEDEQLNLTVASSFANNTFLSSINDKILKTKILIAMFNDYNFSNILQKDTNIYNNFFVFGQRSKIWDEKFIFDNERDKNAIETNNIYNESVEPNKRRNWDELSYHEKESNRASADHIKVKQKYLNLFKGEKKEEAEEKLALCEHNRWNAYHFLNGWVYSEKTIKEKKLHSCLVSYNSLSEEIKNYDREMIKNIQRITTSNLGANSYEKL